VVGIDQGGLDLNEVDHLLAAWHETLVEHLLHDIVHFVLQLVVSVELGQLDLENQSFKLLSDASDELKTWFE